MTEMAGSPLIRVHPVSCHRGPSHTGANAQESGTWLVSRVRHNHMDWIIFGTGFDLAFHANRGRNDRNTEIAGNPLIRIHPDLHLLGPSYAAANAQASGLSAREPR